MTTFQIKTNFGPNETVTADSYEIEDGWVHFHARGGDFVEQIATYPAASILSIRGEVKPDHTVRISAAAFTGDAAHVRAEAAKKIAARWRGRS